MLPEKYNRVEVGRRIRRLRQMQGMTGQQLAIKAKISAGYLSEVERGLSSLSYEKLLQVAEGLDVTVEALLEGSPADEMGGDMVAIPKALSDAADRLNLTHRATLSLLKGKQSLTARRSQSAPREWLVEDWIQFYDQVKHYLPKD